MMVRAIAALVLLCGACADSASEPVVPDKIEDTDIVPEGQIRAASLCEAVATEGPCSLACEPEALVDQYVPEGVCMTYACELADGQTIRTGGCNL